MATVYLWSLQWSPAQGAYWKQERECSEQTANEWLAVYQKDSPNTLFQLAAKSPKLTKEHISKISPKI